MKKSSIIVFLEIAVPLFFMALGIYIGVPVFFGSDIGFFGYLWRIPVSFFIFAVGFGLFGEFLKDGR